jgi:glyoxylase-like metal-dependent hydrolase (beta-lactamase superfamily II)
MNNLQPVSKSTFAVINWDSEWKSYNNSYIVASPRRTVLIDTGKSLHQGVLREALRTLGRKPEDVDTILYTHGHKDHVGGSILFPHARNFIDRRDIGLLPKDLRARFVPGFPSDGRIDGVTLSRLGFHTGGSTLFYYPEDKVLFCGDHVCFFGNRLGNGGLVRSGSNLRSGLITWYSKWAVENSRNSDQAVRKFRQGIERMAAFPADYLCTGHGPVLCGRITEFLEKLLAAV